MRMETSHMVTAALSSILWYVIIMNDDVSSKKKVVWESVDSCVEISVELGSSRVDDWVCRKMVKVKVKAVQKLGVLICSQ